MKTWEYCIIEFSGIHSDQDREERVDELHKLGADGWELAVTTSAGSQYHTYLIFKRPKILDTETYVNVPESIDDDELNEGGNCLDEPQHLVLYGI